MATPGVVLALGAEPEPLARVPKVVMDDAQDVVRKRDLAVDALAGDLSQQRVGRVGRVRDVAIRTVRGIDEEVVVLDDIEDESPRVGVRLGLALVIAVVLDLEACGFDDLPLRESL